MFIFFDVTMAEPISVVTLRMMPSVGLLIRSGLTYPFGRFTLRLALRLIETLIVADLRNLVNCEVRPELLSELV